MGSASVIVRRLSAATADDSASYNEVSSILLSLTFTDGVATLYADPLKGHRRAGTLVPPRSGLVLARVMSCIRDLTRDLTEGNGPCPLLAASVPLAVDV